MRTSSHILSRYAILAFLFLLLQLPSVALADDPDTTAPSLHEQVAVPRHTNSSTPHYTFYTDEEGTITYGGDCSSPTTLAVVGNNTVTFDTLADGEHGNCSVAVTDAAGNAIGLHVSSFTTDTAAPVITLIGATDVAAEAGTPYVDPGATAADTRDGNLTSSVSAASTVDAAVVGTYTVTYRVYDEADNAAVPVVRTVRVVDTTAPVITLSGDVSMTVRLGDPYLDAGATATDTYDPSVQVVTTGETINTAIPGTYHVTYDAMDTAGNAATQVVRTVVVRQANGGGGGGGGGGRSSSGRVTTTPSLPISTTSTSGEVLGASTFNFSRNLTLGSQGTDVTALQQRLIAAGFLYIPAPTGFFGPMTKAAVKLYQQAHGITPVSGYVGPLTRAALSLGVIPTQPH